MKDKWKCANYTKLNWDETPAIHYSFPKGSLEEEWRDEALRHRKEIEELKKELELEKAKHKELREYIKENTISYYTNIEETNEEFEFICNPKELLEILDKENKNV